MGLCVPDDCLGHPIWGSTELLQSIDLIIRLYCAGESFVWYPGRRCRICLLCDMESCDVPLWQSDPIWDCGNECSPPRYHIDRCPTFVKSSWSSGRVLSHAKILYRLPRSNVVDIIQCRRVGSVRYPKPDPGLPCLAQVYKENDRRSALPYRFLCGQHCW